MPLKVVSLAGTTVAEPTKQIPPPPRTGISDGMRAHLDAMFAVAAELSGQVGDDYNRAVRFRDLLQKGFIDQLGNAVASVVGSPSPGPPGPPGAPAPADTPDATPPPTLTGLAAIAGLTSVIVSWDVPVYIQGHGPKQVNLYAVKKAADDATLPTFADAARVAAAPHALGLMALPSDLAIRWHIWAKYETNDGVESTAAAGGANGVVAQTGLIDGTDLAPLLITADKLSQGTFPNINLVANPGAEDGLACWGIMDQTGTVPVFALDTSVKLGGLQSFRITKVAGANGATVANQGFPVIPGETYSVKVRVMVSSSTVNGVYVQMQESAIKPTSGTNFLVAAPTHTTTLAGNIGVNAGGWTTLEYQYTVPAGIFWASFSVSLWVAATCSVLWFDDVSVGRQITASSLAANSIAVGSLAVQAGAIVRAMIGLAAIDDARVAELNAAKLTAGDGTIGGNLKSSNFASGTAGWIVQPNGYAEFSNVVIRGAVYTGTIFANAGTIGGFTIGAADLRSTNYVPGTTGLRLNADGSAEFNNIFARGTILATGGTIGGVVMSATDLRSTNYVAGTAGYRLTSGGSAEFYNILARGNIEATSLNAATGVFDGTLSAAALTVAGAAIFAPAYMEAGSVINDFSGHDYVSGSSGWERVGVATASINPGATGSVSIIVQADWVGLMISAGLGSAGGGDGGSG